VQFIENVPACISDIPDIEENTSVRKLREPSQVSIKMSKGNELDDRTDVLLIPEDVKSDNADVRKEVERNTEFPTLEVERNTMFPTFKHKEIFPFYEEIHRGKERDRDEHGSVGRDSGKQTKTSKSDNAEITPTESSSFNEDVRIGMDSTSSPNTETSRRESQADYLEENKMDQSDISEDSKSNETSLDTDIDKSNDGSFIEIGTVPPIDEDKNRYQSGSRYGDSDANEGYNNQEEEVLEQKRELA
jgi:hypothetical protein